MRRIEPIRLQSWARQFNRSMTEAYILSGCLQDEEMLAAMRRALPCQAFGDPRHRLLWTVLVTLPDNAEAADIVSAARAAIESYEREARVMPRLAFDRWLDQLIPFSPAPCLTPLHAAWLLELNGMTALESGLRAARRALQAGATASEAMLALKEACR